MLFFTFFMLMVGLGSLVNAAKKNPEKTAAATKVAGAWLMSAMSKRR